MLLIWEILRIATASCRRLMKFLITWKRVYMYVNWEWGTWRQDTLTSALDFQGFPTICFVNQNGMIINQYNGPRDKRQFRWNLQ
jgi:hypothetical protein